MSHLLSRQVFFSGQVGSQKQKCVHLLTVKLRQNIHLWNYSSFVLSLLTACMLGIFRMICCLLICSKLTVHKRLPGYDVEVYNGWKNVGPDLDPHYLRRFSADNFSKQRVNPLSAKRQIFKRLYITVNFLFGLFINEPVHECSNNVVCATSKISDQLAHTRSLIRAFASRLSIL